MFFFWNCCAHSLPSPPPTQVLYLLAAKKGDEADDSSLLLAVLSGNLGLVNSMLEGSRAAVNRAGKGGATPILVAASLGNVVMLNLLLSFDAGKTFVIQFACAHT
jgi:ankyrin repeat protein